MSHKYSVICNSVNSLLNTGNISVTNGDFLTPTRTTNGWNNTVVPTGWSGTGGFYHCNGIAFVANAIAGTQYFGFQGACSLYQDIISFAAGDYTLTFYAAPRNGLTYYNTTQNLTITIDDVTVVNGQTLTSVALSTLFSTR